MSDEKETNVLANGEFKQKLASLYSYLSENLQIKTVPSVVVTNDQQNALNPFGFTGYYDPSTKTVRLYVTGRHPTDILRSFAHEVIHHWQNENGTLIQNGQTEAGAHYAQQDENLRKREMEAYLFGNIMFRDWQDQQRYGPPKTPPVMPQPINENLMIQNSRRLKDSLRRTIEQMVRDGTIKSYHRDKTSGDMNANDFIEDFTSKLVNSLSKLIQSINNRGNWEIEDGAMIKEE